MTLAKFADKTKWVCYLIASLDSNDTYIGATNDPAKRLYNHNRKGTYGAKRTRGQTWIPIIIISGFENKICCLSFEAGWKRIHKTRSNDKLNLINLMCQTNLSYLSGDTKWNRLMDLMYFTYNFTYIEKKFKMNHQNLHPVFVPPELILNIFQDDWIKDLPWTYFVRPRIVRVPTQ